MDRHSADPVTTFDIAPFAGAAVLVQVEIADLCRVKGIRVGFHRALRYPEVLFRAMRLDGAKKARLLCWVPRDARSIGLFDGASAPLGGCEARIVSVRKIALAELIARAALRHPMRLLAILRLARRGSVRGVNYRFARLTDELNAPSYREWLRIQDRLGSRHAETLQTDETQVLVTLDGARGWRRRRVLRSLQAQTWHRYSIVDRADLPDYLAAGKETYWIHVPADMSLAPQALEIMVGALSAEKASAVYTDEDHRNFFGGRHNPFFKPAFSPLLARSGWLPLDAAMIRLSSLRDKRRLLTVHARDILISFAEGDPSSVLHLPQVLVHRHRRRRPPAEDTAPLATNRAKVSVVIPTRDRADLLRTCLDGLRNRTANVDLDIVIVDNDSTTDEAIALLRSLQTDGVARVVGMAGSFNFSRACNVGVEAARHEHILLLNNDVDPINPDWLIQMVSELDNEKVGAVGALLLFPDGYIQHAGTLLGAGSVARHWFSFLSPRSRHCRGLVDRRRELSAVTAACLLTRKDLWRRVGGMDEVNLAVAFNDVDYCLKLRALGLKIVFTPHARLYHAESVSRGPDDTVEKRHRFAREEAEMHRRWARAIASDPYHNPNLSKVAEEFVLEPYPLDQHPRRS